MHVLIIDDQEEIAKMEKAFIDAGHPDDKVTLITRPRHTFLQELIDNIFSEGRAAHELPYKVVIIDFNLAPTENGLMLATLLRSLSKKVRIVLVSAEQENFEIFEEEIKKLNIFTLTKPFMYQELMAAMGY